MRKSLTIISLIFLFIFISTNIKAQETAQDWTKTDCTNSIEHQLFSELESGKVVILEYVSSTSGKSGFATSEINKIIEPYATSHPDRVRFYIIGYNDKHTCSDMEFYKSTNDFDNNLVFKGDNEGIKYYGGFGDPTIVILGGSDHRVLYKKLEYIKEDNTKIKTAIDDGLQLITTSVKENNQDQDNKLNFHIYPNPANTNFTISFGEKTAGNIQMSITDISGKQVKKEIFSADNGKNINVDISEITTGIYFLNIRSLQSASTQKISIIK